MYITNLALDDSSQVVLQEKLGQGAFGLVRKGVWKGQLVAVKIELAASAKKYLQQEVLILQAMQSLQRVPRLLAQGVDDQCCFMVTELLGESLNDKFKKCGRLFSTPTVTLLATELIGIVESVHSLQYLHRDIKPHNFLVSQSKLYIIDFGLARKAAFSTLSEYCGVRKVCGTLPFVSLNLHLGMQYAKRDDLESLGYMFIYFLRGSLPWLDPKGTKLPEYRIRKIKQDVTLFNLCRDLPEEIQRYMTYVRALKFDQEADYGMLKTLFVLLMRRLEVRSDYQYEWERQEEVKSRPRKGSCLISRAGVSYTQHFSGTETEEEEKEDSTEVRPKRGLSVITKRTCLQDSSPSPATSTVLSSSHKPHRAVKFLGLKKMNTTIVASKNKFRCAEA